VRLADFIVRNMESILAQREAFAATRLPAAASTNPLELLRWPWTSRRLSPPRSRGAGSDREELDFVRQGGIRRKRRPGPPF